MWREMHANQCRIGSGSPRAVGTPGASPKGGAIRKGAVSPASLSPLLTRDRAPGDRALASRRALDSTRWGK